MEFNSIDILLFIECIVNFMVQKTYKCYKWNFIKIGRMQFFFMGDL